MFLMGRRVGWVTGLSDVYALAGLRWSRLIRCPSLDPRQTERRGRGSKLGFIWGGWMGTNTP